MVTYKGQEYKYLNQDIIECLRMFKPDDEQCLDEEVAILNLIKGRICAEYKQYYEMLKDYADDRISLSQIVDTILEIIFRSPKWREEFTEMKITCGWEDSYEDYIRRDMIDKINSHAFGADQYQEIG